VLAIRLPGVAIASNTSRGGTRANFLTERDSINDRDCVLLLGSDGEGIYEQGSGLGTSRTTNSSMVGSHIVLRCWNFVPVSGV
jgi:hypothetical protein